MCACAWSDTDGVVYVGAEKENDEGCRRHPSSFFFSAHHNAPMCWNISWNYSNAICGREK